MKTAQIGNRDPLKYPCHTHKPFQALHGIVTLGQCLNESECHDLAPIPWQVRGIVAYLAHEEKRQEEGSDIR